MRKHQIFSYLQNYMMYCKQFGTSCAKVKKEVIGDRCNLDNFLFPELMKLMQQCSFGIMNRQKNVSIINEGVWEYQYIWSTFNNVSDEIISKGL